MMMMRRLSMMLRSGIVMLDRFLSFRHRLNSPRK
jgi:hypothetical protein